MEFPTSSFIGTNHIPDDQETERIKLEVIDPCIEQLEQLDASITSLKARLHTLEQKRSSLSLHIDRHHALIAPVRRLSHDILREIFTRCLPSDHFALMKTMEAPLLFGRVCSAWRQVAMTTPELWTSIHIPYIEQSASTRSSKIPWMKRLEGISSWISRSGALPLSISCYFLPKKLDVMRVRVTRNLMFIPDLFEVLLAVKSRWRHLDISATQHVDLKRLLDVQPASLSSLESFSLRANDHLRTEMSPLPGIVGAPHLRHLAIHPLVNQVDTFPCHHLTSLSISFEGPENGYAHHLPTIFTQCHSLVELTLLMNASLSESTVSALPPPSFPRLQSLELHPDSSEMTCFSSSYMPELKHLKLGFISLSGGPGLSHFFGALPPLETLSMTFSWGSTDGLIEALRSQAALTELTLNHEYKFQIVEEIEKLILSLTIGSPADLAILPRLESFAHINTRVRDVYYKPFLLSRAAAPGTPNSTFDSLGVTSLKRARLTSANPNIVNLLSDPELSTACAASGLDLSAQHSKRRVPRYSSSERDTIRSSFSQFDAGVGVRPGEADAETDESDDDFSLFYYS
ncbi:hypothetical protein AX16_009211 [Volvariella volvacea WC 439]|nr:hypothetical protein AX16_009211 [Volvariella volvacea WC 439]